MRSLVYKANKHMTVTQIWASATFWFTGDDISTAEILKKLVLHM